MFTDVQDAIALLGFMEETDALDFLQKNCILADKDEAQFRELARKARVAAREIPRPKLQVSESNLPNDFKDLLESISNNPRFPETVKSNDWAFKSVEIDGLVSFQKFVNVDYASLIAHKCDLGDAEEQINFCLTDKYLENVSKVSKISPETYAVSALGYDLRVLSSKESRDETINADIVSYTLGFGVPFVQVVKCEHRYLLKNGYHRVFALKAAGLQTTPCILIQGKNRADIGIPPIGFFGEEQLFSENPPTFSSFFNPNVSQRLKLNLPAKIIYLSPDSLTIPPSKLNEYLQPVDDAQLQRMSERKRLVDSAFLDIKPINEAWNIYRLSNGTVVKLRKIPIRAKKNSDLNYTFDESEILVSLLSSPESPKGKPNQKTWNKEEIRSSIVEDGIKFKTISEPINEYMIEDGQKLAYRIKLAKISRTKLFDSNGDSVYSFETTPKYELILRMKK